MWLEGGDRRIGKSTIIKITAEFFFFLFTMEVNMYQLTHNIII